MARPRLFWSAAATAGLAMALGLLLATAGSGQAYRTIIEEWAAVQPPPLPPCAPSVWM